ncbi:MAG: RNA recognition motif domain-containing protein [Luteolibacter sp.]
MMKLFVSNISYDTTEEQVRDAIGDAAEIVEFHRPNDRETGKPRGFAFITLGSREDGEKAIEILNETKIDGRELRANEAEERGRGPGGGPERPKWVSLKVPKTRPVDDRPIGADGKRVRYKGI